MKIAVYCSSSNHIADEYKLQGYKLGQWIGESANSLIFGGATGGLMTSVSEGAASKNAEIIGIIPQAVIKMNRQSPLCSTLVSVNTMSERKSQMKEIADILGFEDLAAFSRFYKKMTSESITDYRNREKREK